MLERAVLQKVLPKGIYSTLTDETVATMNALIQDPRIHHLVLPKLHFTRARGFAALQILTRALHEGCDAFEEADHETQSVETLELGKVCTEQNSNRHSDDCGESQDSACLFWTESSLNQNRREPCQNRVKAE